MKHFFIAAALVLTAQAAVAADPASEKILDCMRTNIPESVRIQEFELTSIDRSGGQRQMRGRVYAKRDGDFARVTLKIESPSDLAGSAYLIREGKDSDEIYLYLPAMRKVRRINGPSQDGKLWGTDLSFNDIKQMQNAFRGGNPKVEPAESLDGRLAHVLSLEPRPGETARYTRVRAWVDQKTCVALKVEFADAGGVHKRILSSAKDLRQAGKIWYVGDVEMSDLKDATRTRLQVKDVTAPEKLADRLFTATTFYVGG
jgi:outer membrane lipoprotein-sorting protein